MDQPRAKQSTLILGDLHGRKKHAATVLYRAGAMNIHGSKNHDVHVICLGDIVSLGYDQNEADFLNWVWPYLDEALLGNHELAPLWFNDHDMAFWGYGPEKDPDTSEGPGKVHVHRGADPEAVEIIKSHFQAGGFKVATHVGKWLISHAGVHPRYQEAYLRAEAAAEDIAHDLNGRFDRCIDQKIYDDVISRPCKSDGGIFWLRMEYLAQINKAHHIPQIAGHTPQEGPRQHADNLWCIDTQGGAAGLLTHDDGETFELITSLP